jgi:hypothetical protein
MNIDGDLLPVVGGKWGIVEEDGSFLLKRCIHEP